MQFNRRPKPTVILNDDDEDEESLDVSVNPQKSATISSTSIFKKRKPKVKLSNVANDLQHQDDDTGAATTSNKSRKFLNYNEDEEEDENGDDANELHLNITVPRRSLFKRQNIRSSNTNNKNTDPMDIDSVVADSNKRELSDVLNRYQDSTSQDQNKVQESIEIKIDDDNEETIEKAPIIPTSFEIKELKDRRFRHQQENYDMEKQENLNEDYDSDFEYLTSARAKGKVVDQDEIMEDIELDERFHDGRLAVSENEVKVQKFLKKEEIEEALYGIQLENEDEQNDAIKNGSNQDEIVVISDGELLDSVTLGHVNLDSVSNKNSKSKPPVKSYKLPKFHKPTSLSNELASLKITISQLSMINESNRAKLIQLTASKRLLDAQREELLKAIDATEI